MNDPIIPPAPTQTGTFTIVPLEVPADGSFVVSTAATGPDPRIAELEAAIASYKQALAEVDAVIEPLSGNGAFHRADFIKTQLAQLAGAQAEASAAKLERDAARKALDLALEEPCTLCGKQRKDRD